MTPETLIDHYGSLSNAAKAVGFSYQSLWAWKKRGRIPRNTQCLIELRTGGQFMADVARPVSQPESCPGVNAV